MRHYRIINRGRFICFVLAVILIFCFVIMGILNSSAAKEKVDMRYIKVEIEEGDTLWALAKVYGSEDKDIREIVYDICKINGIKASDLRPGQIIMIPEDQ